MIWFALAISVGLFVLSLKWSRAVETAGNAMGIARHAMAILSDKTLSDDEKERAARESSGKLLLLGLAIAARLVLALAVPALFLGLLVALHLVALSAVAAALESWTFLVASAIVIGAAMVFMK